MWYGFWLRRVYIVGSLFRFVVRFNANNNFLILSGEKNDEVCAIINKKYF